MSMQPVEETFPASLSFFAFRGLYLRARRGAAMEEVTMVWRQYRTLHGKGTRQRASKVPHLYTSSLPAVSSIPKPVTSASGVLPVLPTASPLLVLPADVLRLVAGMDVGTCRTLMSTCRLLRTRLVQAYLARVVSIPVTSLELRRFIADERVKVGSAHSGNGCHRLLLLTLTHRKRKETHRWYFREKATVRRDPTSPDPMSLTVERERTLDRYVGSQVADRHALLPLSEETYIKAAIRRTVQQAVEMLAEGTVRLEDKVYRHVLLRRGCGPELVDGWVKGDV
jgi:hypothetical protein